MTSPLHPQRWQVTVIEQLQDLLARDLAIQALALFGSSQPQALGQDAWSDVDLLVVVAPEAVARYHPDVTWLEPLQQVYTYEQFTNDFTWVTRACFRNGQHVDFVFTTPAAVADITGWPQRPWWHGLHILFARSQTLRDTLARASAPPAPPLLAPEAFDTLIRNFRFRALLAVTKIVRADLLIALHLVLSLQQDYCVLGMTLRDRAEGTSHHRTGGIGNEFVTALQVAHFPFTVLGLLASLEQTITLFDTLAVQWDAAYWPDSAPLYEAVARARQQLAA